MIVQDPGDGTLLLIRQTDHALLSGLFAAAWGGDAVAPLEHRAALLCAAARHDDGWADWELAPTLNDDGTPMDFIRIPVEEHVALYRRGIDLVELEDPYAGLVVSIHGERLYTRPFVPGMDPRIDRLEGRDLELAQEYVRYEHERQAILAVDTVDALGGPLESGDVAAAAEEAWRLVQVWDRLSLYLCMQPLNDSWEQRLPPIRGAGGNDIEITAHGISEQDVVLQPYPFTTDPASFAVEAFVLRRDRWDDEQEFRQDVRTAPRRLIHFRCQSG